MNGYDGRPTAAERGRTYLAGLVAFAAVMFILSILLDGWWKLLTVVPGIVAIVAWCWAMWCGVGEETVTYERPDDDHHSSR